MSLFTVENRDTLIEHLVGYPCHVEFTKVDGTTRQMRCTLNPTMLPARPVDDSGAIVEQKPRKVNLDTIRVYDLDKKDWRAFRIDSVTEFYVKGEEEDYA